MKFIINYIDNIIRLVYYNLQIVTITIYFVLTNLRLLITLHTTIFLSITLIENLQHKGASYASTDS